MRANRLRTAALLACVALLAACAPAAQEMPVIDIMLEKTGDASTVTLAENQVLIDVTSLTGIGGLQATLKAGEWPEQITARLRLRGLESLEIGYGDLTLSTGMSSTGDPGPALMLSISQADGTIDSASPSADVYYPAIERGSDTEGDYFDVSLPPHFFQRDYPSFTLKWIDFYR